MLLLNRSSVGTHLRSSSSNCAKSYMRIVSIIDAAMRFDSLFPADVRKIPFQNSRSKLCGRILTGDIENGPNPLFLGGFR